MTGALALSSSFLVSLSGSPEVAGSGFADALEKDNKKSIENNNDHNYSPAFANLFH